LRPLRQVSAWRKKGWRRESLCREIDSRSLRWAVGLPPVSYQFSSWN
jgi:hypothetical protein